MDNKDFSRQSMDDIIFDNRNKSYGAYVLRETYQKHLLKALVITFSIFTFGLYSPKMARAMGFFKPEIVEIIHTDTIVLEDIEINKEEIITKVEEKIVERTEPTVTQRYVDIHAADPSDPIEVPPTEDELNQKPIGTTTTDGPDIGDPPFTGKDAAGDPNGPGMITEKEIVTVDQKPKFIGGDEALEEFLRNHLIYPSVEERSGIEGEAIISFIVGTDGRIENVHVSTSSENANLDKEALRVVKMLDKMFRPAKLNGRAVRSSCAIPIGFIIPED